MKTKMLAAWVAPCAALLWAQQLCAATPAGEVLAVNRAVYVQHGDQQTAARPAMPLVMQDAVVTDVRSRTKLYFQDDSILNMGERSRVQVEEYLYNAKTERSRSVYRLVEGSLRVVVGRSDLEIHTPTAVAAARGTDFVITVGECGATARGAAAGRGDTCVQTTLMVMDGEVRLRNLLDEVRGTVVVAAGQTSKVSTMQPPAPVSTFSPAQQAEVLGKTATLGSLSTVEMADALAPRAIQGGGVARLGGLVDAQALMQETQELSLPAIAQEPIEGFTPVIIKVVLP